MGVPHSYFVAPSFWCNVTRSSRPARRNWTTKFFRNSGRYCQDKSTLLHVRSRTTGHFRQDKPTLLNVSCRTAGHFCQDKFTLLHVQRRTTGHFCQDKPALLNAPCRTTRRFCLDESPSLNDQYRTTGPFCQDMSTLFQAQYRTIGHFCLDKPILLNAQCRTTGRFSSRQVRVFLFCRLHFSTQATAQAAFQCSSCVSGEVTAMSTFILDLRAWWFEPSKLNGNFEYNDLLNDDGGPEQLPG